MATPSENKRNEKKLSTVPRKTWTPSEDMCHNNNQATCAELNTDKDKRLKSACPSKTIHKFPRHLLWLVRKHCLFPQAQLVINSSFQYDLGWAGVAQHSLRSNVRDSWESMSLSNAFNPLMVFQSIEWHSQNSQTLSIFATIEVKEKPQKGWPKKPKGNHQLRCSMESVLTDTAIIETAPFPHTQRILLTPKTIELVEDKQNVALPKACFLWNSTQMCRRNKGTALAEITSISSRLNKGTALAEVTESPATLDCALLECPRTPTCVQDCLAETLCLTFTATGPFLSTHRVSTLISASTSASRTLCITWSVEAWLV